MSVVYILNSVLHPRQATDQNLPACRPDDRFREQSTKNYRPLSTSCKFLYKIHFYARTERNISLTSRLQVHMRYTHLI